MAFAQNYFVPLSAMANSNVPRIFLYLSSDALATVIANDYFLDQYQNLLVGDIIKIFADGATSPTDVVVTAVSRTSVTVAISGVQELTASGAVTEGVESIELNHATVAIAATIADAKDHQGLLVVKDTSASGTAAHTLTLTSGTFDGTNSVATLNAPNECLVVYIDSAGNGTIVENVGTVALS